MGRNRRRIVRLEECPRCRAQPGARCRNYKGALCAPHAVPLPAEAVREDRRVYRDPQRVQGNFLDDL